MKFNSSSRVLCWIQLYVEIFVGMHWNFIFGFECPNPTDRNLVLFKDYDKARCMDGSPAAFYLRRGHDSGENKWAVFLEGGGWCSNFEQCVNRSLTSLGSSKSYANCLRMKTYTSPDALKNPMM